MIVNSFQLTLPDCLVGLRGVLTTSDGGRSPHSFTTGSSVALLPHAVSTRPSTSKRLISKVNFFNISLSFRDLS